MEVSHGGRLRLRIGDLGQNTETGVKDEAGNADDSRDACCQDRL